jgi:long-subunit acyl-CoA synthetase (AMP-forming)
VAGRVIALEDACSSAEVRRAVLKEMDKTAASAKLLGFERIKNIHLTMEPFSIENDLLTPTFKLKRCASSVPLSFPCFSSVASCLLFFLFAGC